MMSNNEPYLTKNDFFLFKLIAIQLEDFHKTNGHILNVKYGKEIRNLILSTIAPQTQLHF